MSRSKIPEQIPDIEEDEELEDEDEEDDEMGGMDMFEALGSLLATDDGETIASSLSSLKDAAERIAMSFEMQNKILVKILSAISSTAPAKCSGCPCVDAPAPAPSLAPAASAPA